MDVTAIAGLAGPTAGNMTQQLRAAHTPAEQRKVVAGQFEAIMLRQMLSSSIGQLMGGDDSPSGSIYGYMMTDTLSQKIAEGGGLGLSSIIQQQLTPAGEGGVK
ncbi:MAG TPA: hypothetical protein VGL42_12660 [Opitutaceae bacterium]|jgi:Rod binding domain-containing protein